MRHAMIVVLIIFYLSVSHSQTMTIHLKNGNTSEFKLKDVDKITYSLSQDNLPTNGLVAYFPFNGNARDESGNNYNGRIVGALPTNDRFGNGDAALEFNGHDTYVEIPDPSGDLNFDARTQSYTICVWVKPSNVRRIMVILVDRGASSPAPISYTFQMRPSEGFWFNMWNNIPNGDCDLASKATLKPNRWYFLAMGVTNQTMTVYVDGEMVGSRQVRREFTTTKNNHGAINIGRMMEQNSDYFDGVIDDIRIYNRGLSNEEILILYKESGWRG